MELEFNSFPLNVYDQSASKSLLKSIEADVPYSKYRESSISDSILSSYIKKVAGAGLLCLVDDISIGLNGKKARRCLADLIREQINRVNRDSSLLLREAQINLLATSCVTDYLSSLESGSWSNGVKNIGKTLFGLLSFKNPLEVLAESTSEVLDKYDNICQVYHIAFLLTVYNSNHYKEDTVRRLIIESLCNDSNGKSFFSSKTRPFLFSDTRYKTLEENLKYRLDILSEDTKRDKDLCNPFVKWRIDLNAQYG